MLNIFTERDITAYFLCPGNTHEVLDCQTIEDDEINQIQLRHMQEIE